MAKYIIDIPEKGTAYYTTSDLRPYTASESYIDGLKNGQNEVWEFIKKIDSMKSSEIQEAYTNEGSFVWPFNLENYKEAKDRYEKWKAKKVEIRVGDEVIPLDTKYDTMVVTKLWASEFCDDWVDTIAGDGKTYHFSKTNIIKTGRHFDSVKKLLEEMRKSDD